MADVERTLQLLWGDTQPAKRGPKPSLTVQQIIEQAITIADAEGLDAVSMHRVAKELGVTTMSLYRYVPGKDDLLELMVDTAVGEPPELKQNGWRERLMGWTRAQYEAYRERPWILDVPLNGPPMGPKNLAWMNQALASLIGTGLDEGQQLYTLMLITNYVRGAAQLDFSLSQAESRTGVPEEARDRTYAALMRNVVADERFSALAEITMSGVWEDEDEGDPDEELEFGLERIMDGVQALIDRSRH